jgi:triacylglycerol lipase
MKQRSDRSLLWLILLSLLLLTACGCSGGDDDSSGPAVDEDAGVDDDGAASDDDNDASTDDDDDDNNDAGDDDDSTPNAAGTKYPIVLMHGFVGWGDLGPLAYFSGVLDDLTAQGYKVIEPAVSPINSMEVRAHQWADAINRQLGPHAKFNVIAHSQGGLDTRYLISTMGWGDRVGALVSVSTPHQGAILPQLVDELVPAPLEWLLDLILNLFGMDWDGISQITHEYVQNVFNPANPDDPRVDYYSYQADAADNCFFLLEPTHFIISLFDGPNDGVVDVAGARYGVELGLESADHWSIIGQPVGFANFDQLEFYRDIARFLKDHGY